MKGSAEWSGCSSQSLCTGGPGKKYRQRGRETYCQGRRQTELRRLKGVFLGLFAGKMAVGHSKVLCTWSEGANQNAGR